MGCTNANLRDARENSYTPKETLYYKLRDQKHSNAEEGSKEERARARRMVNESVSSDESQSEDSRESNSNSESDSEEMDAVHTNDISKISVLYMHKPVRPSKLQEILYSDSRFDYSDARSEALSVNRSDCRSDKQSRVDA